MTTDPIKDFFEEAAPKRINPNAARAEFAAMALGFQTARRRHRIRMASASALFAFGLTAGGTALLAAIDVAPSDRISEPAGLPDAVPDIADAADADAAVTDPDSDDSTGAVPPDQPEATDNQDDPDDGDNSSGTTADPGSSPTESPATPDDPTDSVDPAPDPDDEVDEASSVDTTEPAIDGATYRGESLGGTITVELIDGALRLVSVDETDGFTTRVDEERPDKIEVRFRNDDLEYRIEIRLANDMVETRFSGGHNGDSDDDDDDDQDSSD